MTFLISNSPAVTGYYGLAFQENVLHTLQAVAYTLSTWYMLSVRIHLHAYEYVPNTVSRIPAAHCALWPPTCYTCMILYATVCHCTGMLVCLHGVCCWKTYFFPALVAIVAIVAIVLILGFLKQICGQRMRETRTRGNPSRC